MLDGADSLLNVAPLSETHITHIFGWWASSIPPYTYAWLSMVWNKI